MTITIGDNAWVELTESAEVWIYVRRNGEQERIGVLLFDDLDRLHAVCEAIQNTRRDEENEATHD